MSFSAIVDIEAAVEVLNKEIDELDFYVQLAQGMKNEDGVSQDFLRRMHDDFVTRREELDKMRTYTLDFLELKRTEFYPISSSSDLS